MDQLPHAPATRTFSITSKPKLVSILAGTVTSIDTARKLADLSLMELRVWLTSQSLRLGELITRPEMADVLARLSLHFHRPDFGPAQASLIVSDFMADLTGATAAMVDEACGVYRRDPANKFFPTPGMLLQHMRDDIHQRRKELAAMDRVRDLLAAEHAA